MVIKKLNKILIFIQLVLLVSGAILAARPLYRQCRWKIMEIRARIVWEKWISSEEELKSDIKPAVWMEIPDSGIKTLVIQNATKENLIKYPCLSNSNSGIDKKGVKLIMGHRDMHFRKLEKIKESSIIKLELENSEIREYRVSETEILTPEKAEKRFKEKGREEWLVLMTCYPFKYIGPAPERFIVWAKPELKIISASGKSAISLYSQSAN